VDEIGSRYCPMAGFVISFVDVSSPAIKSLSSWLHYVTLCYVTCLVNNESDKNGTRKKLGALDCTWDS
jgi:hypothetical protein